MRLFKFLFFTLLISSCGGDNLKKVETLGSFRVLAIQSATPEITQNTGLTVTARPYVSDIDGAGRTVSAVVEGCIDPGISFGANVNCEGNITRVSANYTVDTSTLPLLNSGWGPFSASLSIPDTIFLGRSTREKFNGVPYIIIFSFTVDGLIQKSFRRILITNRTSLNNNPTLTSLLLNGATISRPRESDSLSAIFSGSENYNYILSDDSIENRNENLTISWYVSKGELNLSKVSASESVRYNSPTPVAPLLIIAVLRDERGGITVRDGLH